MNPDPLTISPEETINNAFHLLSEHRCPQAPVIEDEKLIGIFTDRDLSMSIFRTYVESDFAVGDVVRVDPVTMTKDAEIEEAARIRQFIKVYLLECNPNRKIQPPLCR